MTARAAARGAVAGAFVALSACGGAPHGVRARGGPPPRIDPAPLAPRWVLTREVGALFDPAPAPTRVDRQPAIVRGVRVVVDGGLVVGAAASDEPMRGFRSIPARLGGGFLVWSDARIYRAATFLGPLEAIADAGSVGGARPWIGAMLVRGERGVLEVDPVARRAHRIAASGLADGVAIDAHAAVRLDRFGRASITTDGGATWTDVTATRGVVATALVEESDGVWLTGGGTAVRFDERGQLLAAGDVEAAPALFRPRERSGKRRGVLAPPDGSAAAPQLPSDAAARAVAAGAPIAGGRIAVTREGGLEIVATATGRVLRDVDRASAEDRFRRCQAFRSGTDVLLACPHEGGGAAVALSASLSDEIVEATFVGGAGFVGDDRGHLAYVGRCGSATAPTAAAPKSDAPSDDDARDQTPAAPRSRAGRAGEHSAARDRTPPADAAICVRSRSGAWVERRLAAADAAHLARWIVGEDGAVTALVSGADKRTANASAVAAASDGVRIVRIALGDRALEGARIPPMASPTHDAPLRAIDRDFWLDDRGAVRGWVDLVDASKGAAPERSARVAGVRIEPTGRVTVFAAPPGLVAVVRGGRFAIARADADGHATYLETTDGGETWRPIDPSPVIDLDTTNATASSAGCSETGCTWGGQVRFGWGARRGSERKRNAPVQAGALVREPDPIAVACQLHGGPNAEGSSRASRARASSPVVSLHSRASELVAAPQAGGWSVDAVVPFEPDAPIRHVAVHDAARGPFGSIVPLVGPHGIDEVLLYDKRRVRLDRAAKPQAFEYAGAIAAMVEAPAGDVVALDAERGIVVLARGDAAAPIAHLAIASAFDRMRLTLARRSDPPGLAIVGVSATSGEVVAGDLDLGRAIVAPVTSLGSIADAGACGPEGGAGGSPAFDFVAALPLALAVDASPPATIDGLAWITARAGRLCLRAIEAPLADGRGEIVASFGAKGAAALRAPTGARAGATCAIRNGVRPARDS